MSKHHHTATETAVMAEERRLAIAAPMNRLLRKLRDFVRAYPLKADDAMPDHTLEWVGDIRGDGPEKTVFEAIKCNPDLWLHALPDDVCIVPKNSLDLLGFSKGLIVALEYQGDWAVRALAAQRAYDAETVNRDRGTP